VVPNTEPFRRPGNRTGTVSYMAPELIKRQQTDQRIDVFSYAVSCFEMYTRRLPWDHSGVSLEMVLQHINQPPADIRALVPEIDEQIADAIMIGLATHPSDRWSSVTQMLREFRDARKRLEGVDDVEFRYLDKEAASNEEAKEMDYFGTPGVHSVSAHEQLEESDDGDDFEDVSQSVQGSNSPRSAGPIVQHGEDADGYIDLDKYFEVDDDDDDDGYEAV
jgi:serine/threonine protein kinase